MKKLSKAARVIVTMYLVILFFMLIAPPTVPGKPMKGGMPTDYGALFVNILTLSVVAAFALAVSSLLSSKRKGRKKEELHGTGTDNV